MDVTHAELIKVAHGLSQIRGVRYQVFGYRVRGQYETGWVYAVSPTLAKSNYKPTSSSQLREPEEAEQEPRKPVPTPQS